MVVAEGAADKARASQAGLKEQIAVRTQRIEVLDKAIVDKDKQ